MKAVKPSGGKAAAVSRAPVPAQPARCKATLAELSDYLDGKLKHPLRQELKRHLKSCQPCQAFLASLKGRGRAEQFAFYAFLILSLHALGQLLAPMGWPAWPLMAFPAPSRTVTVRLVAALPSATPVLAPGKR